MSGELNGGRATVKDHDLSGLDHVCGGATNCGFSGRTDFLAGAQVCNRG